MSTRPERERQRETERDREKEREGERRREKEREKEKEGGRKEGLHPLSSGKHPLKKHRNGGSFQW